MSELKPCPFCTTGAVYEQVDGGADSYRWAVGCSNLDCIGVQSLKTYSRKKDAAEVWNNRPIEDALVEVLRKFSNAVQGMERDNNPQIAAAFDEAQAALIQAGVEDE